MKITNSQLKTLIDIYLMLPHYTTPLYCTGDAVKITRFEKILLQLLEERIKKNQELERLIKEKKR